MEQFKPILNPAEITDFAIDASTTKATARPLKQFLLAITAGLFIGIGMVFFLVSQQGLTSPQGTPTMPIGMAKVVGGLVFSVGLALVVVTGAELFTGSTLALGAAAVRRISWGTLLKYWLVVYLGNLLGAAVLVALMWGSGVWEQGKGSFGLVALKAAEGKTSHTFVQSLCLGILCNLLVCLGVWMAYAGRTVVDKVVGLTLPVAMFVASGFEHSVANMFLLPFATLVKTAAPASFWAASGAKATDFPHLGWTSLWTANLIPVTLGNIIGGGVMVGLLYTWIHKGLAAKH